MFYDKFISFLKNNNIYDEEVVNYLNESAIYVDYKNDVAKSFIGCYPETCNGIITDVNICVPTLEDNISICINIHEYVHLLILYRNIGNVYTTSKYEEVLPIFYELLFLKNNSDEDLIQYYEFYKKFLKNSNDSKHVIAVEMFDDIYEEYNRDSIDVMEKKFVKVLNRH